MSVRDANFSQEISTAGGRQFFYNCRSKITYWIPLLKFQFFASWNLESWRRGVFSILVYNLLEHSLSRFQMLTFHSALNATFSIGFWNGMWSVKGSSRPEFWLKNVKKLGREFQTAPVQGLSYNSVGNELYNLELTFGGGEQPNSWTQ